VIEKGAEKILKYEETHHMWNVNKCDTEPPPLFHVPKVREKHGKNPRGRWHKPQIALVPLGSQTADRS
jgi:hypothetical protein